jgi:ribosome-associated heat shock protein Hsp15
MEESKVRIDKWLWAARFFKTRSLSTDAINGGKVHVNRERIKPARSVKVGDKLTIRQGFREMTVIVQNLSTHRGPATVAQKLYEETPESIEKRLKSAEEYAQNGERPRGSGRPTKRDQRAIHRFINRDSQ